MPADQAKSPRSEATGSMEAPCLWLRRPHTWLGVAITPLAIRDKKIPKETKGVMCHFGKNEKIIYRVS